MFNRNTLDDDEQAQFLRPNGPPCKLPPCEECDGLSFERGLKSNRKKIMLLRLYILGLHLALLAAIGALVRQKLGSSAYLEKEKSSEREPSNILF